MTPLKFHKETAAIVLLGNFNPAIFHPQWLASKQLIRESEATHRLGLNRDVHVDLKDDETWHALGHRLAPKEPWKDILREQPGMMNLVMRNEPPPPGKPRLSVHVSPSSTFAHTAQILVNAEYSAPVARENDRTEFFVERIREDWESAMRDAGEVFERLVRLARGES